MFVSRLKNPQLLLVPEFYQLIERMAASKAFFSPIDLNEAAEEIASYVTDDDNFMLVGVEDGEYKGILMGNFPTSKIFKLPTILVIYSEGRPALRKALLQAALDLIVSRGYSKAVAINGTGRDDAVWLRALTPEGMKPERLGSAYKFIVE